MKCPKCGGMYRRKLTKRIVVRTLARVVYDLVCAVCGHVKPITKQ